MNSIIAEILASAAARGVQVTIFGNDYPVAPLTLKWVHREFQDGARSTFSAAGYSLIVLDLDGDASEWVLKRGKEQIESGGTHECQPFYHFDLCLLAAEEALRRHVRARIVEIRRRRVSP